MKLQDFKCKVNAEVLNSKSRQGIDDSVSGTISKNELASKNGSKSIRKS